MNNTYKPELLVPAGDFDCLRAGVQNGADAIYFGSTSFSARSSAKNFSIDELKEAINYCRIRNVKTNLTINTLLTDDEINDAIELAKKTYEYGIDAIIVQDLGFAKYLIDNFPGLEVHASTQITAHNLEGVKELEKLGFSRVVLSRELSIDEIEYIRENTNVELETFIHGALCISYSGQCLFSSLIGGRSGNRGKCAQPCRLPYELLEEDTSLDKGYLLSPKDLCGLTFLPKLIKAGVNSFKVEGRMKNPEYVATVTRIYRKYIDLVTNNLYKNVDEKDHKDLVQVFNRGGLSTGHLDNKPNKDLIYPSKSCNMGIYIGNISNYNANKGYITLQLNEPIAIGDTISIDGETGQYTVSELMVNNQNHKTATIKEVVKLGRMKGNIKVGKKVYKMSSKMLSDEAKPAYAENANFKKIPINFSIKIKNNEPIEVKIVSSNIPPFYLNTTVIYKSDIIPEYAINCPLTKETIAKQFSKLGNTPYSLNSIDIDLDDNLHIASISELNNLRRTTIDMLIEETLNNNDRIDLKHIKPIEETDSPVKNTPITDRKISLLLEDININDDYSKLVGINNIYIPLGYFLQKKYSTILKNLCVKFNMYIYMPTIMKANYKNVFLNDVDDIVKDYNIKGFVVSNIAGFNFLKNYLKSDKYDIISNYTMNIFNKYTIQELKKLGINRITSSVESNLQLYNDIFNNSPLPVELIAYGRTIVMNTSYCLLGKTNKCYPECDMRCRNGKHYYLKDRLGYKFRIRPDNIQTVTSIYNSKITSIDTTNFNVASIRLNILDENVEEINNIVSTIKTGSKLEGNDYTNGNLARLL